MNHSKDSTPPSIFFMWRIFTYKPWPQLVSGLMWILFHSWPLFPGLLAKAFFDLLTGEVVAGLNLTSIVVLIVSLALVRVGFVYIDVWVGLLTGFKVRGWLQRNMVACILKRPGAQALPHSPGEAISTLRDDTEAMWGAGWAFDVVGFTIFAAGGISILLWVDARVTLVVFLPIIAVIVLAHVVRTRLRRLREQSREATAQVTGAMGEIFAAAQAIQVAGAEDRVIAHLRRLGDERQRMVLQDRLLALSLDAVFDNTANLGAGITLLIAASAMRTGSFTIGDFALFSTYLMQVAGMTGFLGWIVTEYQRMGVAFRRAIDLLQGTSPARLVAHHPLPITELLPPLPKVKSLPTDPLDTLEVEGLTLHFPPSGLGITDISFALARGSLTVVAGRIGSGKTTLLRAMLGLLEPQQGEIRWNGERIADPACFLVPPRAAYTSQVPMLFSGTLRDNILLGHSGNEVAITKAIHRAVFDRDLNEFPTGLETIIGTRGVKLSGGQIQRTAAARMFVREPELLVFDDLSSALDVETEQQLWQRVLTQKRTYLVVSHRRKLLEQADQILLLAGGRMIGCGTLETLLETSPEMQQLYAGQI